jgi:hypothetical protein
LHGFFNGILQISISFINLKTDAVAFQQHFCQFRLAFPEADQYLFLDVAACRAFGSEQARQVDDA